MEMWHRFQNHKGFNQTKDFLGYFRRGEKMSRRWKQVILILFDAFIIQIAHISSYFFLFPLINIEARPFFVHLFLVIFTYIVLGYFTKIFDKINRFTSVRETILHAAIITVSFILVLSFTRYLIRRLVSVISLLLI